MTERLKSARWQLGNLTHRELLTIRDDIANLLAAYESGGALTGRGSIELKVVKRMVPIKVLDDHGHLDISYEERQFGPYAYIRRWAIDERGKVTLTSSGYYGLAGAEAVERGMGDQLLEAHITGGESAGDAFLEEHDLHPPYRRSLRNKPLSAPPTHPLGDPSITPAILIDNPIYKYFQQFAPADTLRLLVALRQYEADIASFRDAEKRHLEFRLSPDELQKRRKKASRREHGQPPRRIRRS